MPPAKPLILIAAAAGALLTGCSTGEAGSTVVADDIAAAPLPVEVAAPSRRDIHATYHMTGVLSAESEAPALARVRGDVVEVLVEEGDVVAVGQALARLDGDRLRLEMNQAAAELARAEGEYRRMTDLHDRGLVSSAEFEGLKFDAEALRAAYRLKKLQYDYTTIRSPISGVISARNIKRGQNMNPGDIAFRITDTSRLVAYLIIPQSEIARIKAGDEASIMVDAVPGTGFRGTIDRIGPTIDTSNGTFRATTFVGNDNGSLAPGMFGRFEIAYERRPSALTIPLAAVIDEDDESVVYVVDNGAAVRRVIRTGIRQDGLIEVLSGVDESDQVVIRGQTGLRDGTRVLASVLGNAPVSG